MLFGSVYAPLDATRERARNFLEQEGYKPKVFAASNVVTFFGELRGVAGLIAREPEILYFAALQWIVIWLAYLAWTQALHWIPDQVWDTLRDASDDERKGAFKLMNLVLLGWSFLVIAAASYPIGICNAAMVAVHDLRTTGKTATLGRCLAVATRHVHRIWMFTVVDSWITVDAILDRLPKKHGNRTPADELLYYAWKVCTMAVVPALVNGRNFLAAGRDSYLLLTSQPKRALGLQLGYSAVCWVIGILTYVAAITVFARSGIGRDDPHFIYNVYFLVAGPIFVAVGAVAVLVRPFFLLSVAKFYTDLVDVKAEIEQDIATEPSWEESVLSWKFASFVGLVATIGAAVFFGDELGLTAWIERLANQDLLAYHQQRI